MTPLLKALMRLFPEIPQDLASEPQLIEFADVFEGLLLQAKQPSPCATERSAAHHYYLKLIGPLSIYGFGLATRERTLSEIQDLLNRYEADPGAFAAGLVPQSE